MHVCIDTQTYIDEKGRIHMYVCEYIERKERQTSRQADGWTNVGSEEHQGLLLASGPAFPSRLYKWFFDGPELAHYSLCLNQFVAGVST